MNFEKPRATSLTSYIRLLTYAALGVGLWFVWSRAPQVAAQTAPQPAADKAAAGDRVDDARLDRDMARSKERQADASKKPEVDAIPKMNVLNLYLGAGPVMIPITMFSVVVIFVGIERGLALRRSRVMPEGLVASLGQLAASNEGFDPRKAYRVCQQYPSAAADVIRAMLLKVGRPHGEVERAVSEASDREATSLYSHIRWLTLAGSVGPLLGLLGTVQGMIEAFFITANAPPGGNKATMLAEGIYVALVATFGGLAVAIVAVTLANWLEGRIHKLFLGIGDLANTLLPHVERFEGKLRTSSRSLTEADRPADTPTLAPTTARP